MTACVSSREAGSDGYGRSPETAIPVRGLGTDSTSVPSPADERAYLDRLRGPNGEPVTYERTGSCCTFPTDNSPFGGGRLDIYEVRMEGREVDLYLNMYDPAPDTLRAADGFILVNET